MLEVERDGGSPKGLKAAIVTPQRKQAIGLVCTESIEVYQLDQRVGRSGLTRLQQDVGQGEGSIGPGNGDFESSKKSGVFAVSVGVARAYESRREGNLGVQL